MLVLYAEFFYNIEYQMLADICCICITETSLHLFEPSKDHLPLCINN